MTENIVQQLQVMPRIRTFYRDLFGASDHTEIKYSNIEQLFIHTIGTTSEAVISYMIRQAEREIGHTFEPGYNDTLQHTYCREDRVIRARYVPAVFTSPLIFAKFMCDWYVRRYYERIDSPHAVYWVHNRGRGKHTNRVLVFMCGIGIGPITYFNLMAQFLDAYDIIIMVEIKWISFHISSEPVADVVLIQDVAHFITEFLHKQHLGCFYQYTSAQSHSTCSSSTDATGNCGDAGGSNNNDTSHDLPSCCVNYHHIQSSSLNSSRHQAETETKEETETVKLKSDNKTTQSVPVPLCPCDIMMHSGGALYFRRLIKKLNFRYKILIEPACFLGGSSTATLQLYTYNTFNPLFQFPLIKNLPKLLDIAECVLQTNTPMENAFLILSQDDSLFNPIPCAQFMAAFHPNVEIYFIENSGHGGAVANHYLQTADIILKKIGGCYHE